MFKNRYTAMGFKINLQDNGKYIAVFMQDDEVLCESPEFDSLEEARASVDMLQQKIMERCEVKPEYIIRENDDGTTSINEVNYVH